MRSSVFPLRSSVMMTLPVPKMPMLLSAGQAFGRQALLGLIGPVALRLHPRLTIQLLGLRLGVARMVLALVLRAMRLLRTVGMLKFTNGRAKCSNLSLVFPIALRTAQLAMLTCRTMSLIRLPVRTMVRLLTRISVQLKLGVTETVWPVGRAYGAAA